MSLLVLGAGGQVGRELCTRAAALGLAVRGLDRRGLDITDRAAVDAAVAGADLVVNCAAYTAVDKAESEPEAAKAINAVAPGDIAAACQRADIPMIHISTDYVFDGAPGPAWVENDPIAPLSVYGATKAEGELRVRGALPQHLILRTSWVFAAHGANFVRTMLRLGRERPELGIVGDQLGGPTAAPDIAEALLVMAKAARDPDFQAWGTYHFSGAPAATWFDFASAIFKRRPGPKLKKIATRDYPTPAHRPANSVLDCAKIANIFGITQPDWRQSLDRVLSQLD